MRWPTPMPQWIDEAFRHRGLREIPGKQHNKTIINWLVQLHAWWRDDETPWCGTFVAHCLIVAGIIPPKSWFRAKEYASYGENLTLRKRDPGTIPFGAIGVKSRKGGGHVFFIVARSRDGDVIYALGGNQSNMVNIVPMHISNIDAIVWPAGQSKITSLPIATASDLGAMNSGSEA